MINKIEIVTIIGGVIGYILFIIYLESPGMKNIIFRNGKIVPSNIIHFMKNPFKRYFLWYPSLWCANWLIMTSVGMGIGYLFAKLI